MSINKQFCTGEGCELHHKEMRTVKFKQKPSLNELRRECPATHVVMPRELMISIENDYATNQLLKQRVHAEINKNNIKGK